MIRKYLSLICATMMVLSLAACGNSEKKGAPAPVPQVSSEASAVESSLPEESSSEPETVTTTVSDKNIYEATDMEFSVEGVKVTLAESLKDTKHNVLYLDNAIEIPVMTMVDNTNTMVYNIVLSKEDLTEKVPVATVAEYKIYVDSYSDTFPVTELTFTEGEVTAVTEPASSEASEVPATELVPASEAAFETSAPDAVMAPQTSSSTASSEPAASSK